MLPNNQEHAYLGSGGEKGVIRGVFVRAGGLVGLQEYRALFQRRFSSENDRGSVLDEQVELVGARYVDSVCAS